MSSETSEDQHLLFIFGGASDESALVSADGGLIPSAGDCERFGGFIDKRGAVERQTPCDLWGRAACAGAPDGFRFTGRRELSQTLGAEVFRRSCAAYQMMNLFLKNQFCGVCGKAMTDHARDRARFCSSCGNMVYPALSNAVIVAVEKKGRILLGHNVNFPAGRYSVLAGFVEPGETLEDAVKREIMEESGVRVMNIRYFGSQPWPFPNSMMLGFIADWESGEPEPDGGELNDVRWFSPDELPNLPPSISISRQLIEDWRARASQPPRRKRFD